MKKTFYFVFICIALVICACKKENTNNNTTTKKIIYNGTPAVITAPSTDFNLTCGDIFETNGYTNGLYSFAVHIKVSTCDTSLAIKVGSYSAGVYYLVTHNSNVVDLPVGTEISTISMISGINQFNSGLVSTYYTDGADPSDFYITPGSGDKYICGAFVKDGVSENQIFYGWMLINYSADGKTLTVKESAFNSISKGAIKVGEK
ncbi:MAG TPA: hypothetical protein PK431_03105 [Chitinophagales bacterium]|jgi:hypothetical protein|nr:hypothetical protein [Chitinophagales bacterium]